MVGAQAEGISYTFTLPATTDTFTFTYFYAVVFEDPRHSLEQQPRFFVTAYDVETGAIVSCASFDYVSNGTLPGFERSPANPNVMFKNWSPASLQFAGLSGRTVRLEFKTADCTLGGHFGYAYLDVAQNCTNILSSAPYCRETNSLILNAPFGFATYTWYNTNYTQVVGNQQSITLSPPPDTVGLFHVDAVPFPGYGCRDTFDAVVRPYPVPDTPVTASFYRYCQNDFAADFIVTADAGAELLWYTSAMGGIPVRNTPKPITTVPGTFYYYVSQKVLFGCESLRKKITIEVLPTPKPDFSINAINQCLKQNLFVVNSTSTALINPTYQWVWGNGQETVVDTITTAQYQYAAAGVYTLKLRVINGNSCVAEKQQAITVVAPPVAAFTAPAPVCQLQTLLAVTDQSTVPGGLSALSNWWWSFNGVISQDRSPVAFTPAQAGTLVIKQVVRTAEGCLSDTNTVAVTVRAKPVAAIGYSGLLCNNEVVKYKSYSTLAGVAAQERLSAWQWQLNNTAIAITENFLQPLPAGVHTLQLKTFSNYGCESDWKDTIITIYSKPQIQLALSDSCILRAVSYQATDRTGQAQQWLWNMGNGFKESAARQTVVYPSVRSFQLQLIGKTATGCADSLYRPITIYDNRARAYRDTLAAKDEPVQLMANGYAGTIYTWTPVIGLNNAMAESPVATYDRDITYTLYAITKEGCSRSSSITVKRFAGPELYVPNAFTPNKDGHNDALTVKAIGIKSFGYLAIYNRFGNLVFRTTQPTQAWHGTINGQPAAPGTYVYVTEAVDYKNNPIKRKGSFVLLR
jgi:gliding motility-associated-like protein